MKTKNLILRLEENLSCKQFEIVEGNLLRQIKGGSIEPGCTKCKPNDGCNRNGSSML